MKKEFSNWRTLLTRWISGEANRNDERSLEELAQDDPFLAEALEGYRSVPEADHARSVTRLKANLRKRNEKKNRAIVFYLKRIAAIGVVLLGAWLVFKAFDSSDKKTMAWEVRDEATSEANSAAPLADSAGATQSQPIESFTKKDVQEEGQQANGFTQLNNATFEKEEAAPKAVKPLPPANSNPGLTIQPSHKEAAAQDKPITYKDYGIVETKNKTSPSTDQSALADAAKKESNRFAPAAQKAPVQQTQEMEPESTLPPETADDEMFFEQSDAAHTGIIQSNPYLIKGQVTDALGEPLIGANVLIKNTSQGVVTDTNGLFSINSPSEKPTLVVSYTGYEDYQIEAESDRFLNIQLEEGALQLDEVAVTGSGSRSKKRETASQFKMVSPQEPALSPKGGFKKFEKHIKENLQKPQAAIDAGLKGQVEIGFTIDASGKPTDFKIIRSLGHGCDEEAIRLLEEGPKWNGQPGARHSYIFEFE